MLRKLRHGEELALLYRGVDLVQHLLGQRILRLLLGTFGDGAFRPLLVLAGEQDDADHLVLEGVQDRALVDLLSQLALGG